MIFPLVQEYSLLHSRIPDMTCKVHSFSYDDLGNLQRSTRVYAFLGDSN